MFVINWLYILWKLLELFCCVDAYLKCLTSVRFTKVQFVTAK